MSLADLMKKGFLTFATATPATVATHEVTHSPTVATVASVAVANFQNSKSIALTVATVASVAVANFQNSKSAFIADTAPTRPADLVRDFMEDGLTREEAEALAAISVQQRPPDEWLAMIAELDALIGRYCLATGRDEAAMQSARRRQSLASIPESLAWFRREVARIDGAKAKPAPAPVPIRSEIIEGSRHGAKAARIKLHQPITKELNQ